jgi:hypothetical protein
MQRGWATAVVLQSFSSASREPVENQSRARGRCAGASVRRCVGAPVRRCVGRCGSAIPSWWWSGDRSPDSGRPRPRWPVSTGRSARQSLLLLSRPWLLLLARKVLLGRSHHLAVDRALLFLGESPHGCSDLVRESDRHGYRHSLRAHATIIHHNGYACKGSSRASSPKHWGSSPMACGGLHAVTRRRGALDGRNRFEVGRGMPHLAALPSSARHGLRRFFQ